MDVGAVRVGVAKCDADGLLAIPVATLNREFALDDLLQMVVVEGAFEVYVGHPIGLDGRPGRAAAAALAFGTELASGLAGVPVRLIDERLTTVSAGRELREAGRSTRDSRGVIDQAAAVVILEHALTLEGSTGRPPGTLVGEAS